ncbi:MarR family transcriptional regulator [Gemmatimonadetes bacterium T265]|nr:MarR family transcriptional regulator [Gemmatimonadetes bacterium T265]
MPRPPSAAPNGLRDTARASAYVRAPGIAPGARTDRETQTVRAIDALRRVVRVLRLAAARAEADTGLSAAQLFVLQQVAAAPGQWITALAERTMTDRTSVAAAVDGLATRGLVRRTPSDADRRRVEIYATDAGRALLATAPHAPTQRVLDGLDALTPADLRRVSVGLTRLVEAMGITDAPAPMLFDDEAACDERRA